MIYRFLIIANLVFSLVFNSAYCDSSAYQAIINDTAKRIDTVFRSEAGQPLRRAAKHKPLGPNRGNYVRGYSYSITKFAGRCFYLGERLDQANAALIENAKHYLNNPKDIHDRDSFHWHADSILRFIEMYGPNGSKHPGRLKKETITIVLKPIWSYVRKQSTLKKAEFIKSQTWDIYESENHHAMIFTLCWHFSKIAKEYPAYKNLKYDDGAKAADHYKTWNNYILEYCLERSRKGLFIEMMSGPYNSTLIKGFYNFYDFGDAKLKRSAGLLLDLYFAYWAQEQINGVLGGGKSRIYFHQAFHAQLHRGDSTLAWLYFAIGQTKKLKGHDINALLSDYRPPAIVADIALDIHGRGQYIVKQGPMGLVSAEGMSPYPVIPNRGGIVRYSYCDPAFILGTTITKARPLKDWAKISSQNRWQGVIFSSHHNARIVPIAKASDNRVVFNGYWSIQNKGCLVTQKLKGKKCGKEMFVWISKSGLSQPQEEHGIVFLESDGAYASIQVIQGGYQWDSNLLNGLRYLPKHHCLVLKQEFSPIVLQVMSKKDIKSFDAFKKKVRSCKINIKKNILHYTSIYDDRFSFDMNKKEAPTLNGKSYNYEPSDAFKSPFLNAKWNSGIVTISKGKNKKVLDFNYR